MDEAVVRAGWAFDYDQVASRARRDKAQRDKDGRMEEEEEKGGW